MAINFDIFDVIIIDADLESRSKLKQAAREINCYGAISSVNFFSEAYEHISSSRSCDIVFISNAFPPADIADFIKRARETSVGAICSYILVMKSTKNESSDIAQSMLEGFNALLLEPYSVETMTDISKLARKVKVDGIAKRVRAASELVVPTLIKEIDRLAALKAIGQSTTVSHGARKARELVNSIGEDALEGYFETLCDAFSKIPPPVKIDYEGPSKRLKNKLEQKQKEKEAADLMAQIETDSKQFQ